MDAAGVLDERYDEVDDIVRARRAAVAAARRLRRARATLDLNALTAIGVQLVGRLAGIRDGKAQFSGSLRNMCALADLKMNRLLDTIDEWATANGLDDEVDAAAPASSRRVVPKLAAARPRSRQRRDPDDRLGDRLPPRLLLARRAGARPQGP